MTEIEQQSTISSFIQKAMARKKMTLDNKPEPFFQIEQPNTSAKKQYQTIETDKEPTHSSSVGKSMIGDIKRLATSLIDSFAPFQDEEVTGSPCFDNNTEAHATLHNPYSRDSLDDIEVLKREDIEEVKDDIEEVKDNKEFIRVPIESEEGEKVNEVEKKVNVKELTIDENATHIDIEDNIKDEWSVRNLTLTESKVILPLEHLELKPNHKEIDEEVEMLRMELKIEAKEDKKMETTQSKTNLIHAANQITARIIKSITSIINPPQSVVNIIISYVAVLCLIDQNKSLIEDKRKTYKNCLTALKNIERVQKITIAAIKFVDKLTENQKKKLRKLRNKYLAGWDMRPEAFSDKYYSARVILYFLLSLLDYHEEAEEKIKRRESPTRLLIEHKTLKIKEAKQKNSRSKAITTRGNIKTDSHNLLKTLRRKNKNTMTFKHI